MIVFPNCKINLGLHVIDRRSDGYHNICTAMIPVPWCDILEIVPSRTGHTTLHTSGRTVLCPPEKNLVMKAYNALSHEIDGDLPAVDIHLEKIVPDGAGLGGGSSDAAFTLTALNEIFALGFSKDSLAAIAATIGADCPMFIYNKPMMATGIGTTLSPIDINSVAGLHLLVAKPRCASISTAQAYNGVLAGAQQSPRTPIEQTLQLPVNQWQGKLVNDFERTVVPLAPEIGIVKEHLLSSGALYAAMSGSGAAVFGLFDDDKLADKAANGLHNCDTFFCQL